MPAADAPHRRLALLGAEVVHHVPQVLGRPAGVAPGRFQEGVQVLLERQDGAVLGRTCSSRRSRGRTRSLRASMEVGTSRCGPNPAMARPPFQRAAGRRRRRPERRRCQPRAGEPAAAFSTWGGPVVPSPRMEKLPPETIIGIDLGTTNSCAARGVRERAGEAHPLQGRRLHHPLHLRHRRQGQRAHRPRGQAPVAAQPAQHHLRHQAAHRPRPQGRHRRDHAAVGPVPRPPRHAERRRARLPWPVVPRARRSAPRSWTRSATWPPTTWGSR